MAWKVYDISIRGVKSVGSPQYTPRIVCAYREILTFRNLPEQNKFIIEDQNKGTRSAIVYATEVNACDAAKICFWYKSECTVEVVFINSNNMKQFIAALK